MTPVIMLFPWQQTLEQKQQKTFFFTKQSKWYFAVNITVGEILCTFDNLRELLYMIYHILWKQNWNGIFKMEHFIKVQFMNTSKRKHPPKLSCLDLYPGSIVNCNVEGEWGVWNERTMILLLRNYVSISSMV